VSHHDPHVPSREEVLSTASAPISKTLQTASLVLAAIGLLVFVAGLFVAPDRAWRAWHFNWLYFTSIASAGVMFVAVQRITTARWSRPIIRLLEGFVAFLPVAWVLLAITLLLGKGSVFPWTHEAPSVAEKQLYLDHGFVVLRDLLGFGILVALSVWYIWTSVRLDVGHSPEGGANWARGLRERMRRGFREERREIHSTHSLQGKLAVVLALVFGLGWSMLAFDLSMALDMHFQSTLYGWWFFMTGWLGAIMMFSLLTMWWRKELRAYDMITEAHFHDLGKLAFAFTAFWGYLTFSQYLVIWYGNFAEETHFMRLRFIPPWKWLAFALIFMNFLIPFLGLVSRAAKVYLPTFVAFATISLVGTWLQRYLEVYPSLYGVADHLPFGIWEIGLALFYLGVFGSTYFLFMNAFPRMRVTLMTSPFRDEVQVPVDPETMEPLPAHE
jgi:hypothetical protein